MQEELADIIEIVDTLARHHSWTMDDIAKVQKEKRQKNGGFETRTILLSKI